jgi:hypothetical protein
MPRSITSRLAAAATGAAFIAAACFSTPALACWDGMAASGEGIHVSLWRSASWRPDTARHMAIWITRLEALVPAGTTVSVMNQTIMCDGPACPADLGGIPDLDGVPEPSRVDMASVFDATAKMLRVSPAERARAASLSSSLYTVQVYAGARKGALAERERVHALRDESELDLSGFYTEGGFPAVHPVAHILADGGTYRVVVGAHRSIAEATRAADALAAVGVKAFVRPMPTGTSYDEPVSSNGEG